MEPGNIDFAIDPVMPKNRNFRIGCIGAGFIMADCHLVAYKDAGFNPQAITSLSLDESKAVAARHNIPKVYKNWKELISDPDIEIVDIAIAPDSQLGVIRELVKQNDHIKGVLCQKPLAMNFLEAKLIVELCEESGIKIGVNSNMRYDQSIRALKSILDKNFLGEPVLATIEMRAIPHWQDFLKNYDHIEILNMGIHHIDSFRYLFGNPERITALTRKDPRTKFNHIDGISQYTLQYANDFIATSLDDVWAWPGEGTEKDIYIKWRVEGMDGMAQGTIDCKRTKDTAEKHADIDADKSHTFRGAGSVELPAPGLGILNYDLYLKLLSKMHPNIPIIIEHLDEMDIPRAKKFIDDKLKKAGC